jgi:hypothetical protein
MVSRIFFARQTTDKALPSATNGKSPNLTAPAKPSQKRSQRNS